MKKKTKNSQPQTKFTGSSKKKSVPENNSHKILKTNVTHRHKEIKEPLAQKE